MSNKPTKYYSSIQERRVADALGWSVVSGSGARDFHPGDIVSDRWMGECKTHTVPGSKLKFDAKVWEKICEEASSKFKYPVLFVDDGSQSLDKTWCVFLPDVYCPEGVVRYNYDGKFKTNLIFEHPDMNFTYKRLLMMSDSKIPIIILNLSGKVTGLVSFRKFQQLFQE